MSGITELDKLLQTIQPQLLDTECVFCKVQGHLGDYLALNPIATFMESEGLTLVLQKEAAINAGLTFENTFRQITLTVHSSLEAVGLTAAVSAKLTAKGISANVFAAYYHDHIFVPSAKASAALLALQELSL
ncbi:ACT domain-containing protein [Shewanella holmiensis]|uniref:ACT domain-containing protein n=1 Tax=Shewanella holmiensis TaxID=2952222 RepID=A0A9X2WK31_9GAMM|nr:ACT domain-containing protein [Shewanella holmiensis]MCT7940615.1 ACT domain-containing protein [Shewanella holmiensis]